MEQIKERPENRFDNRDFHKEGKIKGIFTAVLLVGAGVLLLARNFGWIQGDVFRIIFSWQTLLLLLGLFWIFRRRYFPGITLLVIGSFFMIPLVTGSRMLVSTYWPVILVLMGLFLIFRIWVFPKSFGHHHHHRHFEGLEDEHRRRLARKFGHRERFHEKGCCNEKFDSTDGFVTSDNTFGSVRQIVIDPVFRGAKLRNSFGGTVLDLRRTTLDEGDTCIDLDCTFGGVEIFVPSDWNVIPEVDTTVGAYDDKRYTGGDIPDNKRLLVRGRVTFGGVEVKS